MEIIVKCEISEKRIKELIEINETGLETEQDIKDRLKNCLEYDIFGTLEDNEELFTNISYEIN